MIVGSIKEDLTVEKRVSLTPETVKNIIGLGLKVCIEKDYASHLGIEDNNYKDILLRRCQQSIQVNPEYELVETSGPAHKKVFTSVVLINGKKYCQGTNKTKKESEQIASKSTLEFLDKEGLFLVNSPVI